MSMSKKDFVALADMIREHNQHVSECNIPACDYKEFNLRHIASLADFCEEQNPNFNRDRWLGYIAGTNGQNGGKIE